MQYLKYMHNKWKMNVIERLQPSLCGMCGITINLIKDSKYSLDDGALLRKIRPHAKDVWLSQASWMTLEFDFWEMNVDVVCFDIEDTRGISWILHDGWISSICGKVGGEVGH